MKRTFSIPILFFISFVVTVYFILPKYSQFKTLRTEILQKEEFCQQAEKYRQAIQKTSDELANYKETLKKIEVALPPKFFLPPLLNFFQSSATESGLIIGSISFAQQAKGETSEIQETYFSFNLSGSLSSCENFLRKLEASSRLIEVENISLTSKGEGLLDMGLSVKVYSY